jgi:hypothetical protein
MNKKRKMKNFKTIILMSEAHGTSTNSEGVTLFIKLDKIISEGYGVIISLEDTTAFSSSFLNSSFGELYEKYGFDKLKGRIKIINYQPARLDQIKKYLELLK